MSESMPKEFEKVEEIIPFTKPGLSSSEDFKKIESNIKYLEWLKKAGLTEDEIKLYQDNEAGTIIHRHNFESNILKNRLDTIYMKIRAFENKSDSSGDDEQPSTSTEQSENIIERIYKKPTKIYPPGHPMNELKEIEESLFGHLKNDDILPLTKRRKILRRLERKKQQVISQKPIIVETKHPSDSVNRPGSLWDSKELPSKTRFQRERAKIIGPNPPTMYTIKDNKIVRMERVNQEVDDYHAVNIVVPVNAAEEQLLEGTKMCVDDIKKIERFKDYGPGVPSKVLYLKNIAPSVTQEELGLLFNQFVIDNGGPIDVRLMTGRMRGQAFVAFQREDTAIQALEEVNGTILKGRPVIVQFGRNSNRILDDNR